MQHNRINRVPVIPEFPEKQFSRVSNYLPPLPTSMNSGSWFLRLIHFPENRPEVSWDVVYAGGVGKITQTRFSTLTRDLNDRAIDSASVSIERGEVELLDSEPLIVEVNSGICWRCISLPAGTFDDFYFLYYCDGQRIHKALAHNIRTSESEDIEPWRRLVNRVSGSALLIPRSH